MGKYMHSDHKEGIPRIMDEKVHGPSGHRNPGIIDQKVKIHSLESSHGTTESKSTCTHHVIEQDSLGTWRSEST
jgi:hypothetical protein